MVLWIEEEHRELSAICNPIGTELAEPDKADALLTLSRANRPLVDHVISQLPDHLRQSASSNIKLKTTILEKAQRTDVRNGKEWFRVEHIRDALRFRNTFDSLDDIFFLRDLFRRSGFIFVKIDFGKFLTPKLSG